MTREQWLQLFELAHQAQLYVHDQRGNPAEYHLYGVLDTVREYAGAKRLGHEWGPATP